MQANQIWAGNDYAYIPERGRGQTYSSSAKRVRVIRVFQEKQRYYAERATTYVQVNMIDNDGNLMMRDGREIVRNIRARDIVSLWDDYMTEHEERLRAAEQARIEAQQREARIAAENEAIQEKLYELGLPRGSVRFNYSHTVLVDREVILSWMKEQAQPVSSP